MKEPMKYPLSQVKTETGSGRSDPAVPPSESLVHPVATAGIQERQRLPLILVPLDSKLFCH